MGEARLGPDKPPHDESDTATPMTAGTNMPATVSASRWIGARERCASPTRRTICASRVSLPTRWASITNVPVPLTVPPVTLLRACFSTGIGSPVTIDSSTVLVPSTTHAVDRHPLARPHAQPVADVHVFERDLPPRRHPRGRAVAVVGARPSRRLMARAGPAARAQLQHLAEQHEDDDHGRGLEVHRRLHRRAIGTTAGKRPGASVATTL